MRMECEEWPYLERDAKLAASGLADWRGETKWGISDSGLEITSPTPTMRAATDT